MGAAPRRLYTGAGGLSSGSFRYSWNLTFSISCLRIWVGFEEMNPIRYSTNGDRSFTVLHIYGVHGSYSWKIIRMSDETGIWSSPLTRSTRHHQFNARTFPSDLNFCLAFSISCLRTWVGFEGMKGWTRFDDGDYSTRLFLDCCVCQMEWGNLSQLTLHYR